jgi:hypothetical protein
MKVVAEITRWPEGQRGPAGRVVEVLGPADDVGVDILSIIREMGLPDRFPDSVLRESAQIPQTIPPRWLEGRLDLRDKTVFTSTALSHGSRRRGVHRECPAAAGAWESISPTLPNTFSPARRGQRGLLRGTAFYWWTGWYPCCPRRSATASAHCMPVLTG